MDHREKEKERKKARVDGIVSLLALHVHLRLKVVRTSTTTSTYVLGPCNCNITNNNNSSEGPASLPDCWPLRPLRTFSLSQDGWPPTAAVTAHLCVIFLTIASLRTYIHTYSTDVFNCMVRPFTTYLIFDMGLGRIIMFILPDSKLVWLTDRHGYGCRLLLPLLCV